MSIAQGHASLEEIFRWKEPELSLLSYVDNVATMQLTDWDGNNFGKLVCNEVIVLCIPTRFQEFNHLSTHGRDDLPPQFSWLIDFFLDDMILVIMQPLDEDNEGSLLPNIGGRRMAFIVCKSIHYEKQQSQRPAIESNT
jgi:hypothetical protein